MTVAEDVAEVSSPYLKMTYCPEFMASLLAAVAPVAEAAFGVGTKAVAIKFML